MDIDIDIKPSFDPITIFPKAVRASTVQNGELRKHPCGLYFQHIKKDPITGYAAIPYKEAEQLDFFKIDFLNLSVLEAFKSKQEIRDLLKQEPNWNLLEQQDVVEKLFHLKNWYDVVSTIKPKTVEEIADCLALIRPNKQILFSDYMRNKTKTRERLFKLDKNDKTSFKRAHAIAYASVIVLQLHLIQQGKL